MNATRADIWRLYERRWLDGERGTSLFYRRFHMMHYVRRLGVFDGVADS